MPLFVSTGYGLLNSLLIDLTMSLSIMPPLFSRQQDLTIVSASFTSVTLLSI